MTWWLLPLLVLLVGAGLMVVAVGAVQRETTALRATQSRLRSVRIALARLRRARSATTQRGDGLVRSDRSATPR